MSDKKKQRDPPKVITLDDLERRAFWATMILLAGIAAALLGAMELSRTLSKSLDQTQELTDRAERLSAPPPPASSSEPPKT